MSERAPRRGIRTLLGIIVLILGLFVLHIAQDIVILIVFALFLAILLQPLVHLLNRVCPNWLSVSLAVLAIGAFLAGLSFLFYVQADSIATKAPDYATRIDAAIERGAAFAEEMGLQLDGDALSTKEGLTNLMKRMDIAATVQQLFTVVATGIQSVLGFAAQLLLVLIMASFMLLEAPTLRRKLTVAFNDGQREAVVSTLDSMNRQIQRYITTKTVVSFITGVLTGLITHFLGVDFPVIWGLLAFQLNFIPHVGSIIAVWPPTLMALIQFDAITITLATFFSLASLQFLIGNIIEPRIMGRSMELSPLVVFISMVFWGWFWGVSGIMVAVPMTAGIRIICSHVNPLKPIATMLGNPKETAVASPA